MSSFSRSAPPPAGGKKESLFSLPPLSARPGLSLQKQTSRAVSNDDADTVAAKNRAKERVFPRAGSWCVPLSFVFAFAHSHSDSSNPSSNNKTSSRRWWLVASQPPELTVDTESETGKAVLRYGRGEKEHKKSGREREKGESERSPWSQASEAEREGVSVSISLSLVTSPPMGALDRGKKNSQSPLLFFFFPLQTRNNKKNSSSKAAPP